MIRLRPENERGLTRLGWLDSRHSFSFGQYQDPNHVEFRGLRVINDDRVGPGGGFPAHPHRDMEILTYVLEGQLAHQDSLGTGSVIGPGELQKMSAGSGIRHSEFNASETHPVHFYQIWIYPERDGLAPSYEQKTTPPGPGLHLVASPEGGDEALRLHQDVRVYLGRLREGEELQHAIAPDRYAYVQVTRGQVQLNGLSLSAGDGAAISQEESLRFRSQGPAEILLFDLN